MSDIPGVCDVGVLTIVPTEIEALFSIFEITGRDQVFMNSQYDYWRKDYVCIRTGLTHRVVFSFILGDAGNIESAIAATNFLRDWHPQLLALVGISAGIAGKGRIGDVIIPAKVVDRHLKAYIDGSYRYRSKIYNMSDSIMSQLKTHPLRPEQVTSLLPDTSAGEFKVLKKTANAVGLQEKEFTQTPSFLDGSIVSDDVLVRDPSYFSGVLTDVDEKCRGAEMEAAGFVRACLTERADFPWIIFRGIADFGDHRKNDQLQFHAARNACASLKAFVQYSLDLSRLPKNPRAIAEERARQSGLDLLAVITAAFNDERWEEVCRIGSVLSRPLLLAGRLENRKYVGGLVEKAAAYLGRDDVRAAALIDDIGWTSVLLDELHEAKRCISDGLRICKDDYLSAKGHRHMASIDRQEGKLDLAQNNLVKAGMFAEKIANQKAKTEIVASLDSSLGKLYVEKGQLREGLEKLRTAQQEFNSAGDTERSVKLYLSIGRAEETLGRTAAAIKAFEDGRGLAMRIGRYLELRECTLAELKLKGNGKPDLNDPIFNQLCDYAKNAGLWDELKRLESLRSKGMNI